MNPKAALEKHFPEIKNFRDKQEEVINALYSSNVLCLMPTGAGKSLIYQVYTICNKKTTLVISPLIALMRQQSERLEEKGFKILFLHGGLSTQAQHQCLKEAIFNWNFDFVFFSPERLAFDGYLEFVLRRIRDKIGLIVVDEAHCVSQWGHGFRPTYKYLPQALNNIFDPEKIRILALTATMNKKDKDEICNDFNIQESSIYISSNLMRSNIQLNFHTLENEGAKIDHLRSILNSPEIGKTIVYTHRKKGKYGTVSLSQIFKNEGLNCDRYDADCADSAKVECLSSFESGSTSIIFATNAFGMGVDIPDIHTVVHFLLPESIEQYYQEVGRAGRDGAHSVAHLLFTPTNIRIRKDMIKSSFPKRDQIASTFESKFHPKPEQIFSLNPWLDITEEESDVTLFFLFLKLHFFLRLVFLNSRYK